MLVEKLKAPDLWAKAAIVLVLAGAAVGAALPRTWRVEQRVTIAAPPERIHPLVEDLKRWQEWTVWTKARDPALRNIYEGEASGVGARWTWMGPKMGQGTLEIVEASTETGVTLAQAIESSNPNSRATIRYVRTAEGTEVIWVDEGTLPVLVGGLFRNVVEERLGAALAESLAKLKSVAEAPAP